MSERYSHDIPDWLKVTLVVIAYSFIFGILTCDSSHIVVDNDSPNVYYVTKHWWGLKQERRQIRWMKAEGEEDPAWCAKDKDGYWYPFLIEYAGD